MSTESPRLTALRKIVEQKPSDPFPNYALAMELKGLGDKDAAWSTFAMLIETHPNYLATYAPAGDLLVSQGKLVEARNVFEKGMVIAQREGNHHIKDLLAESLASLLT